MGIRGPVPNRSDDLARPRDRKGGEPQKITKGTSRAATIPDPDPAWHSIAKLLWDACLDSGQADFYESSDYAFLFSICDDVSHYKSSRRRSGQMLASIYSAMEVLLVTEGSRRRVRIELQDGTPPSRDGVVLQMAKYQEGLAA